MIFEKTFKELNYKFNYNPFGFRRGLDDTLKFVLGIIQQSKICRAVFKSDLEDFYLLCDSDRLSYIRFRSRDIGGLREIASIAPAATRDQTVCC